MTCAFPPLEVGLPALSLLDVDVRGRGAEGPEVERWGGVVEEGERTRPVRLRTRDFIVDFEPVGAGKENGSEGMMRPGLLGPRREERRSQAKRQGVCVCGAWQGP